MKQLFYSLRFRIFFAMAMLLIPASLIFGWFSIHQQTSALQNALIERGQLSVRHLAYGAELAVLTHDITGLNSLLHNMLDHSPSLLYAEVYDAQGALMTIVPSNQANEGEDPDEDAGLDIDSKESWSALSKTIYEFRAPITSEITSSAESFLLDNPNESQSKQRIGTVHLALSTQAIQSTITQIIIQGIVTLLLLLLIGLSITWWLANLLTQRLQQIGTVAKQTEQGDFSQRITLTGVDEIAQLGESLNQMLDTLAARDAELRQQQSIMQTILDQAPIGVWMLEMNGKIKFANHTFCRMYNLNERALMNAKNYTMLLTQEVGERFLASDQACFSDGCVQTFNEHIIDDDRGEMTRSFDIIKAPITNVNGEIEGLIGLAIDITARLEAEAEQAKLQKRVEHSQRLESLGVLAGGIAHDFNNILTSIMGNAALAEQKISNQASPDVCLNHISKIAQASEKAALLCQQMLAYSGKGQFVIKPIDLSILVGGITGLLEVSIHHTIELHYELSENIGFVEADEAQIQQVIMNLVINASDAIGEQSGSITIRTGTINADSNYLANAIAQSENDLAEGKYLFLEVVDTGCGMDHETQQRLFEPFFTTKFTGRGLGMSAVLGIVRGHHGAMMVYSEVGNGTVFKVLFPASKTSAVIAEAPNLPQAAWRGSGTVLIIDDEETIRETSSAMLEEMGFQTMQAVDGQDGVEMYQQYLADIVLVLMDMTMPRLDGTGCFTALRAINPEVKVIVSSGYSEQETSQRFEAGLLAGFIQKPYWPDALEAKMREVLV